MRAFPSSQLGIFLALGWFWFLGFVFLLAWVFCLFFWFWGVFGGGEGVCLVCFGFFFLFGWFYLVFVLLLGFFVLLVCFVVVCLFISFLRSFLALLIQSGVGQTNIKPLHHLMFTYDLCLLV